MPNYDGKPRVVIDLGNCKYTKVDGFVKSPSAALRFTFVAAAYHPSTPHSSGFARLASGVFYFAIHADDFLRDHQSWWDAIMGFIVEFYEATSGSCPVREFLDEFNWTDPNDFAAVMAGLAKLRIRNHHRPPLSKSIGDDLLELRHGGKLNTRILYFFAKRQRIIGVHGIRNKAMKIPKQDFNVALDRKRDWQLRSLS